MAMVDNVIWDGSDPIPIILFLSQNLENSRISGGSDNKIFRFEARWTYHADFDFCMRDFWLLQNRLTVMISVVWLKSAGLSSSIGIKRSTRWLKIG